MRRVQRYIGRTVFAAIAVVLSLIIGLDWLASIIEELTDLQGRYNFLEACVHVVLSLPAGIYNYMPLSALVGCLAAVGHLANQSELVILRASGVSVFRITWYVMRPAIAFIIFAMLLSEYVAPYAEQYAKSRKALLLGGDETSLASDEGLWHREGNQFMHFNVVQPGGVLYGVTLFNFADDQALQSASFAKRATYQGKQWLLEDVSATEFQSDRAATSQYNTLIWQPELSPILLNYLSLQAQDLSLTGLQSYIAYLKQQGLASGQYELAFWKKLLHPLAIFSLVLIGIAFVFGPLRSSTAGFRVFVGVITGIVFQFVQDLLGPSSLIFGFEPVVAVILPIAFCLLVGTLFLYKAS